MNRPVCFENGMLTKLTADSTDPMKKIDANNIRVKAF